MDWRTFLILSKTRDYERLQIDRRREDYKRTKERILKYSLQNQVNYRIFQRKIDIFGPNMTFCLIKDHRKRTIFVGK